MYSERLAVLLCRQTITHAFVIYQLTQIIEVCALILISQYILRK